MKHKANRDPDAPERELDADDLADLKRMNDKRPHMRAVAIGIERASRDNAGSNSSGKKRNSVDSSSVAIPLQRTPRQLNDDTMEQLKAGKHKFARKYKAKHQDTFLGNAGGKGYMPYTIPMSQLDASLLPPALADFHEHAQKLIEYQNDLREGVDPETKEIKVMPIDGVDDPQAVIDNPGYITSRKPSKQKRCLQGFASVWTLVFKLNSEAKNEHKLTDLDLIHFVELLFPHIPQSKHAARNWRGWLSGGIGLTHGYKMDDNGEPILLPNGRPEYNPRFYARLMAGPRFGTENYPRYVRKLRYICNVESLKFRPRPETIDSGKLQQFVVTYQTAPNGKLLAQLVPPRWEKAVLIPEHNSGYTCWRVERLPEQEKLTPKPTTATQPKTKPKMQLRANPYNTSVYNPRRNLD